VICLGRATAHAALRTRLIPRRRYGNPAFRVWHARLAAGAEAALSRALPPALVSAGAAAELAPYLCDSFGSAARIDYGTGHETSFCVLLYCLTRLGLVRAGDLRAVGTVVFAEYVRTARLLQRTYWLEPAGSHGVWSLDDYQFLVFLFGASQLVGHEDGGGGGPVGGDGERLPPRAVTSAATRAALAGRYLYLDAVDFVCAVKSSAPFAEHSPILHDIAGMATWAKANDGLLKMYRGEVLAKLPVAQHFAFGSLFAATWTPSRPPCLPEAAAHAAAAAARDPAARLRAANEEAAAHAATVPVDRPEGTTAPWLTSPPAAAAAAAAARTTAAAEPAPAPPAPAHCGSGVVAALIDAVGPLPPLAASPADAAAADARALADDAAASAAAVDAARGGGAA